MPVWALTNAGIYVDSHDFTGDSNQVRIQCEATQLDRTTFRSGGWTESNMGAKTSTLTASGFGSFGADSVDEWTWNNFGGTGKVVTVAGIEEEGQPALMVQSMPTNFGTGGTYNENMPYALNGVCSDAQGVIRGRLLKEQGTVSATGATGTAVQVGATGASQFLYATFHVLGTPGTTITAVVESDDSNTFATATTRITFGPYTTAGGRWATRVAGAIADDWYRLRVTAITGTFLIACAVGVQ